MTGPMGVPCPKCGNDDVHVRYQADYKGPDCGSWSSSSFRCGKVSEVIARGSDQDEHFHRTCRYCGFKWYTFDVLVQGAFPEKECRMPCCDEEIQ